MKLITIMTLLIISAFAQATPIEMSVEFKPTQEKFNQIKKEVEEQIAKEKAERDSLIDEVIADVKSHEEHRVWLGYYTFEDSAKRVVYKHNPCNIENVVEKIACEDYREPAIKRLSRDTYYSEQAEKFRAELRESKPEFKLTENNLKYIGIGMIILGCLFLIITAPIYLMHGYLITLVFISMAYAYFKFKLFGIDESTDDDESGETGTQ